MDAKGFGELDDIGFLREADLFSEMPDSVIRTIMLQAKTLSFSAGDWVVRRGDPGSRLFVVKDGVVEVLGAGENDRTRPIAYLGRGECLGELAILTDSSRTADVRVPEHAELLVVERELFDDLTNNHPGFSNRLCVILAHRLAKLLSDLPAGAGRKELQGSLRYFDLATVIQTLIGSGQSGLMTLTASGETLAELQFQSGNIAVAHYGHRAGDEAIHQLFQVELDADFLFTSADNVPALEKPETNVSVPAMALMLDSIRLQDELKPLQVELPPSTTVLERTDSTLAWPESEGQKEARAIWDRLARPTTVAELLDQSTCCYYHTTQVLLHLVRTEQAMPALDARAP